MVWREPIDAIVWISFESQSEMWVALQTESYRKAS